MSYPILRLKPGREASVGFHHPWIFSGALLDKAEHGQLVSVADRQGNIIATGTYSNRGAIAVRALVFTQAEITEKWIQNAIQNSEYKRSLLGFGSGTDTTGYRVVFSEADSLPGLIIDRYGDVIVLQISTAGMDALRDVVVKACQNIFKPAAIIERSEMSVRREEGLEEKSEVLFGDIKEKIEFMEYGQKYWVDVVNGQKTGFFLDQKELRQRLKKYVKGKKVLNLFSYTGAAGLAALSAGAASVHNIDESKDALELASWQAKELGYGKDVFTTEAADIFQWLGQANDTDYDVILLDPPALTKSQRDHEAAGKAYHFLNRAAIRISKPNGILVTSSCSRFFTEEDFTFTLRRASVQASRQLEVLETVGQSSDHSKSVYFPESSYLKSIIGLVK